MPDIVRVRYLGDTAVIPLAGKTVETDCVFDIPGVVLAEDDDRWLVGPAGTDVAKSEDGCAAVPKSKYRVETPPKKTAKE